MGKVCCIQIKCPPPCPTQLYFILDRKLLFSRCASNDERYSLEPSVSNGNQLPNTIITAVLREGVAGLTFCYTSRPLLTSVSQHCTIPGGIPKYKKCVFCSDCFSNAKLLQSVGVCDLPGKKEGSHYRVCIFCLPWTRPLQFTESLVVKAKSHSVPFLACNRVDTYSKKRATYCAALGENFDKPLGLLTLFQIFVPLWVDAKFCDEKGNVASFWNIILVEMYFSISRVDSKNKKAFWVGATPCLPLWNEIRLAFLMVSMLSFAVVPEADFWYCNCLFFTLQPL